MIAYLTKHATTFWNVFEQYQITTSLRIVHFLAQLAHESANFTRLSENLNYTAQGLANTWPSRFAVNPNASVKTPNAKALELAKKPQAIANFTYANRLGNGNEQSGDGWRFRGRGFIMITGRANYQAFSNDTGINIVANPDKASEVLVAAKIAGWFWNKNNLNALADKDDIVGITKKINGGTIGLADRQSKLKFFKSLDLTDLFEKKK